MLFGYKFDLFGSWQIELIQSEAHRTSRRLHCSRTAWQRRVWLLKHPFHAVDLSCAKCWIWNPQFLLTSALKLWFDTSELVNTAHLLHSRKLLVWSLDQTGYSAWTSAWTSAFCSFCCVLELFELCLLRLLVSLFHWTTKSPAPVLRDTLIVSTRSWQCDYCITPKAHPCGCSSLNLIKMFERQKLHKLDGKSVLPLWSLLS